MEGNEVEQQTSEADTWKNVTTVISKHQGTVLADDEPRAELSDEERQKALKMFDEFDSDDNERLDSEEILKLLEKLNLRLDNELYETYVKGIWDEFDQDDSGKIDSSEFLKLYERVLAPAYQYGERLRVAAGRGEVGLALGYLRRGCPAYTGNGEGQTPLHIAVEMGQLAMVQALFEYVDDAGGGKKDKQKNSRAAYLDVDCQDKSLWTPLHNAAAGGNTAIMRALIDRGADVNAKTVSGRTPLHCAAEKGREHAIKTLLANKAEINARDASGWTPVFLAAVHGHYKALVMLAGTKGVDLQKQDELGRTLRQWTDDRLWTKLAEELGLEDDGELDERKSAPNRQSSVGRRRDSVSQASRRVSSGAPRSRQASRSQQKKVVYQRRSTLLI
mmetsp:Transcript_6945/g.11197  ORF Transcript_6945/g.11197 Transcript_6945/m.11197 type:complete len:389 (-) Transcript_6945:166-1332(-)